MIITLQVCLHTYHLLPLIKRDNQAVMQHWVQFQVQCSAQGHFSMCEAGARNQTSDPWITGPLYHLPQSKVVQISPAAPINLCLSGGDAEYVCVLKSCEWLHLITITVNSNKSWSRDDITSIKIIRIGQGRHFRCRCPTEMLKCVIKTSGVTQFQWVKHNRKKRRGNPNIKVKRWQQSF